MGDARIRAGSGGMTFSYLCEPTAVAVAVAADAGDLDVTEGRRTSLSAAGFRSAMPRLSHQEGRHAASTTSSSDRRLQQRLGDLEPKSLPVWRSSASSSDFGYCGLLLLPNTAVAISCSLPFSEEYRRYCSSRVSWQVQSSSGRAR